MDDREIEDEIRKTEWQDEAEVLKEKNERLVRISAGKPNPRTTREIVEALTEVEVVEMNCIGRGMLFISYQSECDSLSHCTLLKGGRWWGHELWFGSCVLVIVRPCCLQVVLWGGARSFTLLTELDEWVMLFASEVRVGMRAGEVLLEGGKVEACVTVEEWMGMEALVKEEAAKGGSGAGSEVRYKGRVWPCTPLMFDMEEVKARFLKETGVQDDQLLVWRRNVVDGVAESSWWFEAASWPDGVKFHSWDMVSYRRTKVRVTAVCITLGTRKRKRTGLARVQNRKVGGVEEAASWMEERKRVRGGQAEGKEGTRTGG